MASYTSTSKGVDFRGMTIARAYKKKSGLASISINGSGYLINFSAGPDVKALQVDGNSIEPGSAAITQAVPYLRRFENEVFAKARDGNKQAEVLLEVVLD